MIEHYNSGGGLPGVPSSQTKVNNSSWDYLGITVYHLGVPYHIKKYVCIQVVPVIDAISLFVAKLLGISDCQSV